MSTLKKYEEITQGVSPQSFTYKYVYNEKYKEHRVELSILGDFYKESDQIFESEEAAQWFCLIQNSENLRDRITSGTSIKVTDFGILEAIIYGKLGGALYAAHWYETDQQKRLLFDHLTRIYTELYEMVQNIINKKSEND